MIQANCGQLQRENGCVIANYSTFWLVLSGCIIRMFELGS